MYFRKTAACALVASLFATGAMAASATFDFESDADAFWSTNKYEGKFDQVYGAGPAAVAAGTNGDNSVNGITVSASAYKTSENNPADPFLDAGNAGLGVCSSGNSPTSGPYGETVSACSSGYPPSSANGDDNLLFPEFLKLVFDGNDDTDMVSIDYLFIRDANHNPITDISAIKINGDNYSAVGGVVNLAGLAPSTTYLFTSTRGLPEIYLSTMTVSDVPVPAAGLLLLGGLGGLVAMKRRRKN